MMRMTLPVLSLAAVIGLTLCQSAAALPANPGAIEQSASAASPVAQVQFHERHTRHGLVKCYREFVIGRYVCRHVW